MAIGQDYDTNSWRPPHEWSRSPHNKMRGHDPQHPGFPMVSNSRGDSHFQVYSIDGSYFCFKECESRSKMLRRDNNDLARY